MRKQTVADVEGTLEYLQHFAFQAKKGTKERTDAGPHKYARDVLAAAEESLRKVGMYEAAEHAIKESERLIVAGQFDEADQVLLKTVREMMEKSGTNDRLRRMYTPSKKQ